MHRAHQKEIFPLLYPRQDVRKALNVLHEEFFETTYKQVNLFITGTGNVGGKLLAQLRQQQQYLAEHLRLQIRVMGLANSRKMLISEEGIDLDNWTEDLDNCRTGQPGSIYRCDDKKESSKYRIR